MTIAGDGSTVVEYRYTRAFYEFTLGEDENAMTFGSTPSGTYRFGQDIALSGAPKPGYAWDKWVSSAPALQGNIAAESTVIKMPAGDLTMTPAVVPGTATYEVRHFQQGVDGAYPDEPTEIEALSGTTGTLTVGRPVVGRSIDVTSVDVIATGEELDWPLVVTATNVYGEPLDEDAFTWEVSSCEPVALTDASLGPNGKPVGAGWYLATVKVAFADDPGATYTTTAAFKVSGVEEPAEPAEPEKKPDSAEEQKPTPTEQPPAAEAAPAGQAAIDAAVEQAIATWGDADPAGSEFGLLQLRAKKAKKKSLTLTWKRVPGAVTYVLLGAKCGKGNKYVKLVQTSKRKYVNKKLKAKTSYRYIAMAFDASGNRIAVSKTAHAFTKGSVKGNVKKVWLSKKSLRLKVGASKRIELKGTAIEQKNKILKQHRKVMYESSDPAVATVSARKGQIKAVGKGKCVIYAYACDGTVAKCKVTVQ